VFSGDLERLSVADIISKCRGAVFPDSDSNNKLNKFDKCVTLDATEERGEKTTHFSLSLGPSGSFLNSRVYASTDDKVEAKQFWTGSTKQGLLDAEVLSQQESRLITTNFTHDGFGGVWKTDHSGLERELELDDREQQLFSCLLPTGYWLLPEVQQLLDVKKIDSYTKQNGVGRDQKVLRLELSLCRSVLGSEPTVVGRVHIDAETGLVIRSVIRAFGVSEIWDYQQYEKKEGMMLSLTQKKVDGMGNAEIKINKVTLTAPQQPQQETSSSHTPPSSIPLRPSDTTFVGEGGGVEVVVTYGGHLLVPVFIGGQKAGMFLLDSGCGGLVLDQRTSAILGLSQFGEMYASVIGGTVKSSMAQAQNMEIGPMTITNPLFAVMDLSGLLENYEVAGILGYDFFRRTVISGYVPEIFGEEPALALWDPETYEPVTPEGETPMDFADLTFLEDVPHLQADIWAANDRLRSRQSRQMLMLDIGAGETSCILADNTVRNLGLGGSLEAGAGVAALSGGKVEADNFILGGLEVCSQTFERKPSRSINTEELNLSKRAAGAVCAKILSGCRFVVDYPRKRFGIKVMPKTFQDRIKGFFDLLYGPV